MACKNGGCGCQNNISGLAHIGVFVKDIETSKAFYTKKVGFECYEEIEADSDDGVIKAAFIRLGSCEIELVQFPKYEERTADGIVAHIALKTDDIEAAMACLKTKGIEFQTEKPIDMDGFTNGIRYIFFDGPDGEQLELNQIV